MKPVSDRKQDRCCQRLAWADLAPSYLDQLIELARQEDLFAGGLAQGTPTPGDHSSALLDPSQIVTATLRARVPLTVCGTELVARIAAAYDQRIVFTAIVKDGAQICEGDAIGTLVGPVRSVLGAERPLLNFMQKLSGVATETHRYAKLLEGSSTRLLDTRKTTPGYRALEKYAVACGGGWNHRIGLFDRVMLKDNHLAAFGEDPRSAAIAAVKASRERHSDMLVEMEVDSLDQIEIALAAQVDIVLLDNFSKPELEQAVRLVDGRIVTEASGGITFATLESIKDLGLDFISTGALVHQSTWVDIGLDWA